jgi:hypothetical protein
MRALQFTIREMMIGVGVLSLLTLLVLRIFLAGPFLVLAMRAERECVAECEEYRQKAERLPNPYNQYLRELAEYESRMSTYYSHNKWYYFWFIFRIWEPLTIPGRPDVGMPQFPEHHPSTPIPRSSCRVIHESKMELTCRVRTCLSAERAS